MSPLPACSRPVRLFPRVHPCWTGLRRVINFVAVNRNVSATARAIPSTFVPSSLSPPAVPACCSLLGSPPKAPCTGWRTRTCTSCGTVRTAAVLTYAPPHCWGTHGKGGGEEEGAAVVGFVSSRVGMAKLGEGVSTRVPGLEGCGPPLRGGVAVVLVHLHLPAAIRGSVPRTAPHCPTLPTQLPHFRPRTMGALPATLHPLAPPAGTPSMWTTYSRCPGTDPWLLSRWGGSGGKVEVGGAGIGGWKGRKRAARLLVGQASSVGRCSFSSPAAAPTPGPEALPPSLPQALGQFYYIDVYSFPDEALLRRLTPDEADIPKVVHKQKPTSIFSLCSQPDSRGPGLYYSI